MADSDIGRHEFKYIKKSIPPSSTILKEETFTVIVCKYDKSTATPVIPDPVYIEDSETTLTLPTYQYRNVATIPEVYY